MLSASRQLISWQIWMHLYLQIRCCVDFDEQCSNVCVCSKVVWMLGVLVINSFVKNSELSNNSITAMWSRNCHNAVPSVDIAGSMHYIRTLYGAGDRLRRVQNIYKGIIWMSLLKLYDIDFVFSCILSDEFMLKFIAFRGLLSLHVS